MALTYQNIFDSPLPTSVTSELELQSGLGAIKNHSIKEDQIRLRIRKYEPYCDAHRGGSALTLSVFKKK